MTRIGSAAGRKVIATAMLATAVMYNVRRIQLGSGSMAGEYSSARKNKTDLHGFRGVDP
jgi:hypothetical protein